MAHDPMQDQIDEGHDHDMLQQCIEECLNCHAACTMTAQYALGEGGEMADPGVVGVLLDCADICQTSANFMLRGSPYHGTTCAACAEICRACEEACRAFPDDEQLSHCAEICNACAQSCEEMAAMGEEDSDAE